MGVFLGEIFGEGMGDDDLAVFFKVVICESTFPGDLRNGGGTLGCCFGTGEDGAERDFFSFLLCFKDSCNCSNFSFFSNEGSYLIRSSLSFAE